jgi:hypothetical protein
MYKIKVTKTGMGWRITLLKKVWVFWFINTVCNIKQGYEYMVDEQINEWVIHFNIPNELVLIPNISDINKGKCTHCKFYTNISCTYYAELGMNKLCYGGELWEAKIDKENLHN